MKFKGTIIITDPCYIMKSYEDIRPKFSTWPGLEGVFFNTKLSDFTKEQMDAYEEFEAANEAFEQEYDDWYKCDMGENMEALGINHCIVEDTIIGDWCCGTFLAEENPKETIDKIAEEDCEIEVTQLGNFCADAGKVAVFLLDEVREYNPDIDDWIAEHPWCVTTIEDFDGNVEYYVDENREAHIYGEGNINFFTNQIGF